MFQLKFDFTSENIILDIPNWKTKNDIPKTIMDFITNCSNKRIIYERSTEKYYCGICMETLDDVYCHRCNMQYQIYTKKELSNKNLDIIIVDDKKELLDLKVTNYYIAFDILDENVCLYIIQETVFYDDSLFCIPLKKTEIDIAYSYFVEKDGLTNLDNHHYTSFQTIHKCLNALEETDETLNELDILEEFEWLHYQGYIYTNNFDQLKHTIYRYSKIWHLKEYLKKYNVFFISQLTMYPLYYPQFEYLINYQLYPLALTIPYQFKKGKTFEERFGIEKKYLSFMVEHEITFEEFEIMKIYPTTDLNIIRFFSRYYYNEHLYDFVKNLKIDLKTLYQYFQNQNLSIDRIHEYFDYIDMAKEVQLDLKDKNNIYPKNLREAHDQLYNQIEIIEDPKMNEKIKQLSNVLYLNQYEDEQYIIFPAHSIYDFLDESKQQKNCVRTYCETVSNGESQIYFMRKKIEPDQSFVTIEVKDNKIVQARMKYNQLPNEEINQILHRWESTLLPIIHQNEPREEEIL